MTDHDALCNVGTGNQLFEHLETYPNICSCQFIAKVRRDERSKLYADESTSFDDGYNTGYRHGFNDAQKQGQLVIDIVE